MPVTPPTLVQWEAAMRSVTKAADAMAKLGVTVLELSEHLKVSTSTIRRALRVMINSGTIRCVRGRSKTSIHGRELPIPSYVFVRKENATRERNKLKRKIAARAKSRSKRQA